MVYRTDRRGDQGRGPLGRVIEVPLRVLHYLGCSSFRCLLPQLSVMVIDHGSEWGAVHRDKGDSVLCGVVHAVNPGYIVHARFAILGLIECCLSIYYSIISLVSSRCTFYTAVHISHSMIVLCVIVKRTMSNTDAFLLDVVRRLLSAKPRLKFDVVGCTGSLVSLACFGGEVSAPFTSSLCPWLRSTTIHASNGQH